MDVKQTLKPKLELFRGIGFVGTALPMFLSAKPILLTYSVEKQLLPNAEFLKSILKTNENLVDALKHPPWFIIFDTRTTILPKVDALHAYDVPDEVILVLLICYGYALLTDTVLFNEVFDEIKKMRICPRITTFARALGVLAGLPAKKWGEKVENLRGLGCLLGSCPWGLRNATSHSWVSTEETGKIMKFMEEKLGWTPEHTVKYPTVLLLSLEKRMMPRYAVLRVLMHKGSFSKIDLEKEFKIKQIENE
ncbi:hypothetical protein ZIOFF_013081 [Zingiber officinale]|uniref:Uncharacterized protein n=1 Tax=Zingiber officinale TaxID=94328 RepID=A0A8J5HFK9_ZINOF|nr:hypothetical protein ZIOFF_013081 [Zingiber officinale]